MNFKALLPGLIMVFLFHPAALAFSPIFSIDRWDVEQMKKAGISITLWKHDRISEDPPLDWVQISYDAPIGAKDSDVLMTLYVIDDKGRMVSSYRAVNRKGMPTNMSIVFAVPKEYSEGSSLQILSLVPESVDQGASRENPGYGGYSLSLNRIIELAQ